MAKRKRATAIDRNLTPPTKRAPRSQDLPGMEDRAIRPLEDIAASYADVRDRRIALNTEEAELKKHAMQLMHKHGKTIYRHDGIEIRLVAGEEDIKVKVKKPKEDGSDEAGDDEDEDVAFGDTDHHAMVGDE